MRTIKPLATAALLVAVSSTASAQSLEIRKRQTEQEGELANLVALTNTKCGIDLKATIATATFNPDEFLQKSVVSWCSAAASPKGSRSIARCSSPAVARVRVVR